MLTAEIFTGILIFKGFTARRLYKSFGIKGFRAMLPAEIFTGILIFKGFTARRLYRSFGFKGLMHIVIKRIM
jgi:hypothetical protein